ncbi:unnamed protein product, partial [Haemonchus placei]|uniref:G_PROTEIN_RECEP_F1_2 domain-containing protein n=1 Tax=Haemonchus placei TaxID=6290 RepID=A0A0N4X409_HAEPC
MVLNFGSDIPTVLRSECTKEVFVQLMTISYQMQGILSMVVAFDRLLAVTIPIKYIKFGNHYNIIIIATPCVTVLIPTVVNFLLTINDQSWVSALCLTREAVYPGFHAYILLMRMACIISSGLIYLYIVLRLKQHLAKHEKVCHRVDTTQLRNIRHSTVTVGLTTINALVFLFIPDIVAYFEIAGIHQNYATVLYSFYCVNVNLNFLILITRHKEIRQNFAYFVRVILLRRHPTTTSAQSVHKAASNVAPIRSALSRNIVHHYATSFTMSATLPEARMDDVEETVFEVRERRRRRHIPSEPEVPEMQSSDECVVVREETLLNSSTAPTNLGRAALDKSHTLAAIPSKGKETERKRKIEIRRTTADSIVKTKKRKEVEEAVVRARVSALPRQHRLKDKLPIAPRRLPLKNPERPFPNDLTEQGRALIHMDKGQRKGETSATSPNISSMPRQHRLHGIIQASDRQPRTFTPKLTFPNKLIEQEHAEANRPAVANEERDNLSLIEKLSKAKPPIKEKGDQQVQIDEELPPEAISLEETKMQKEEGRPAAKRTTSKAQQQHMEGEQPIHKDLPKNDSESAYPYQPIEQKPIEYGRPQKENRKLEGTSTSALNKISSSQEQHNMDAVPLANQGQAPTFKSELSSPREGSEQETDEERKSGKVSGKRIDETSLITPTVSYLPQQHLLDGISDGDYKQPQAVSPVMSSPNKLTEQEPEEEKKPGKAVGKREDEKSPVTPTVPYMPQQHHLDVASDVDHRRPQAISPVTSFANKLSEQEPEEEKEAGKALSKRGDEKSLVTPAMSYMPQQHRLDVASDADYRQPQAVSPVPSTPNKLSEQEDDGESRLQKKRQTDEEKSAVTAKISSLPKQDRTDDVPQPDHENKQALSPELTFPNKIVKQQIVEGSSPRSERSQRASETPAGIPKSPNSQQQKHMEGEAQKVPKHLAAVGLLLAPFSMLTKHETAEAATSISPLSQQHDIDAPPQRDRRQALAVSRALSSPNRLLDQEPEKETKPQRASEPRKDGKAQVSATIPPLPKQHNIEAAPQRGQRQASAVSPLLSSSKKLLEQETEQESKPEQAFGLRKGQTPLVTPTISSLPQQHNIEAAPQRGKRQALALSPQLSSPNKLLEQEPEQESKPEEAFGPRKGQTPLVTPTISFLPQQHDIETVSQRGKRQALAVSPLPSSPNKLLEQEPEGESKPEEEFGSRKGETPLVTPTISSLPQQHDIEAAPQRGIRQASAVSPALSSPNRMLEQEPEKQ